MEPVYYITGPDSTAVVVRTRFKGHWYYHARIGRLGIVGAGDPIEGSGSFSRQSAEHHASERVKADAVEWKRAAEDKALASWTESLAKRNDAPSL